MKADVIVARCRDGHGGYGIRVEERDGGDWYSTWAFATDEERAARAGYGADTQIGGILRLDSGFPGCPRCSAPTFTVCYGCFKTTCWSGRAEWGTCQWCGHGGVPSGTINRFSSGNDA